jgi:hypothetical protein
MSSLFDRRMVLMNRVLIYTRVEALERHAEHRTIKNQPVEERSPKKSKVETPKAPRSTVRKIFGWAMPSSSKPTTPIATSIDEEKKLDKGKAKETFKDRLEAIQDQPRSRPMTQLSESVSIHPATIPILTTTVPPHPSSPAWKGAGPSRLSTATIPTSYSASNAQAGGSGSNTRPTPRTLSAILAESASSTASSSSHSRPQLHSSLSQRSAALDALFSESISTAKFTAAVPAIKRSSSVKDIVKNFEDSGALAKSMGMGEEGLKRVQSREISRPL